MAVDPPLALLILAVSATGLLRLGELFVSRRRIAARPDALVPEPWLFPLMAALHTGLVVLPVAEVVLLDRPFVPGLAAAAGAALLLATLVRVWTLGTLGRSWNVQVVRPAEVITGGPYAWIRHPNYLVVIVEIAAIPLLHAAWASAVALSALNAFVLTHRIRVEEAELRQVPGWSEAMAHKARLIPGVF